MQEKINQQIFRANDIRGIYEEQLNPSIVWRIGYALGKYFYQNSPTSSIALACDGRLSSPPLHAAMQSALLSIGANVLDLRCVSTPELYYQAFTKTGGNGIMITGSHNPKNHNGIKITCNYLPLNQQELASIRQATEIVVAPPYTIDTHCVDYPIYHFANSQSALGLPQGELTLSTQNQNNKLIQAIKERCPLKRKIKVICDAGNGAAGPIAQQLLNEIGCEVISINYEIDGNFPNHHPDPSQPENLRDLQSMMQKHEAELGLAFDGDGDRLGVISSTGQQIYADKLLMLFAQDLLRHCSAEERNLPIIYDVKSTTELKKWISARGGIGKMCKTGHAHIKQMMHQTGSLLAGEMSGHFFFNHNWYMYDDALYAAAYICKLVSEHTHSNQLFAQLPATYSTPEIILPVPASNQHAIIETLCSDNNLVKLKENFPQLNQCNIDLTDGLRIDTPNSFILIRASNTTSAIVCRCEHSEQSGLQDNLRLLKNILLPQKDLVELDLLPK